MKVYSIGREVGCDIVINDNTDVISRRHAMLNVFPTGKMTIVDQSSNGTYVNGIRISPNVPFPVTRKDNISFAHVARLDWNMVPKQTTMLQYALMGLLALALVAGCIIGYNHFIAPKPQTTVAADTTKTKEQTDTTSKADVKKSEPADSQRHEVVRQKPRPAGQESGKQVRPERGKEEPKQVKKEPQKPRGGEGKDKKKEEEKKPAESSTSRSDR